VVANVSDTYSNRSGKFFSGILSKGVCIAKKDAKVYYFKPQILGFGILIPAFMYLSFSLGREIAPDLLIPGLVGMVSLFGASSVEVISVAIERQTQTYEILQIAPVSTTTIILGKSFAGSAFGIMLSLVTAVGAAAVSGEQIGNPFLFVVAVWIPFL
jgi:ABC-2 type transport system permease protein